VWKPKARPIKGAAKCWQVNVAGDRPWRLQVRLRSLLVMPAKGHHVEATSCPAPRWVSVDGQGLRPIKATLPRPGYGRRLNAGEEWVFLVVGGVLTGADVGGWVRNRFHE
jgi:hypothetical protein